SYPKINYGKLKSTLTITSNDKGKTLTVKYRSQDPEMVVRVLDVVSAAYLRYSLEDRQSDIDRGVEFVSEQLPAVRERVDDLEAQLESLRQESNLIDPLQQGEQLSAQMARFTSEKLELGVQIEQTMQLYEDLQQELSLGSELATSSALLESSRYQGLLNQLLELDSQLANDLTLYLENSPEIAVTAERRDNIQPLLQAEGFRVQEQVGSFIRELDARDQALSQSIDTLDTRIKRLSSVAREYNTIQRDLEIASNNLNEFLTKREALRIDAAQRQTPWEILTPHEYPQAPKTNTSLNLLLGSLLGIFLGSALAITVERLGNKIYTVKELKQASRIPVLGTIPYSPRLTQEVSIVLPIHEIYDQTRTQGKPTHKGDTLKTQSRHFLESFKRLATNVKLSNLDNKIKALTVSSALPNEGKSSVSFYLAHASAAIGQRTLLVDTDLKHPTLHKICNVVNEKGLSNYLAGDTQLEESILNLTADENLFFMPSGTAPPDSAKVLSSQQMEDFYQQIDGAFDLIIFDTPPLLSFSDAFVVAKKTQGVLLTARLGQLKFTQLDTVLDDLYLAKVPTIGIVANGSKEEDDSTYGYYQHYQEEFLEPEPFTPLEETHANSHTNGKGKDKGAWQQTIHNILGKSN
ncbi:MAG: polysaccharide biosynthesis tyrosine autokinase, partial [Cyanobacteria bacterium P01_C01_bin.69]